MIHFGILGTGNIARTFIKEKPENAEISAVASREIEKAKVFAEEFSIPKAYESYTELILDKTIDAVYIPLPHHMHHEYTIRCARAGKHVLCEKPASLSVRQTEEMVKACQENGVQFMEMFMYRFLPVHKKAKEILNSGMIGRLKYINFHFCINTAERMAGTFRMDRSLGGGAIYDLGIYGISLSRYIIESEPQVVQSLVQRQNRDGADEISFITLKFGDISAHIVSSFITQDYFYILSGEKGSIHVPCGTTGKLVPNRLIVLNSENLETYAETFEPKNGYKAAAEYFAQCIARRKKPICDGGESIKNIRVIEEIFKKEKPL